MNQKTANKLIFFFKNGIFKIEFKKLLLINFDKTRYLKNSIKTQLIFSQANEKRPLLGHFSQWSG